jgi:hypothetical protein
MQARVVLKFGDPDRALLLLDPIKKELDSPEVNLLVIEAACAAKKTTPKQKAEATAAVETLKDKITPLEELGRVAAICDPKLPEQLGLPVPGGAVVKAPPPKAPPPKRGRGGRRR